MILNAASTEGEAPESVAYFGVLATQNIASVADLDGALCDLYVVRPYLQSGFPEVLQFQTRSTLTDEERRRMVSDREAEQG